jgi:Xaa-Pro aminopeptidase
MSTKPTSPPEVLPEGVDAPSAAAPADTVARPLIAHHPQVPSPLLDFMLGHWAPRSDEPPEPVAHREGFAARRRALSGLFPGEVLIVPTGHEKVRSNDTHYRFRPGSDFFYLTGNQEPDCVLALMPEPDGGHAEIMFVEPNTRDTAAFFTDPQKGELWVGARLGIERSRERYGVHACRALGELPDFVNGLARSGAAVRVLRGYDPLVDATFDGSGRDVELATGLAEMRLVKDDVEIAELQSAVDATLTAFEDVIRALPLASSEREVEGIFNLRARVAGNDVGYNTIAASGHHACVLHWTRNDGTLRRGDLLLLDAGVEGNSLYTADITRTLPLAGRFNREQRLVYDIVYAAQQAAMRVIRPGIDFLEPNRVAMRVLAEGLRDLGILRGDVEDALRDDHQFYRRYTLHNVSHMIGLDVHDCPSARTESYRHGKLKPGMVFSVEPGLYFQRDDETVPKAFRGIGVRIEDDVLVTADGYRNFAARIPASGDDVEAWIARLWREARSR